MANDYIPFSSAGFPTRTPSFGTGMDIGVQDAVMQLAQQKQLEAMDAMQRQRAAEYERYTGMTPGEISKSQYEGAAADYKRTTPGYIPGMAAGELGRAQSEAAKGKIDTEMAGDRILTEKSGNEVKRLDNLAQYMDMHGNILAAAKSSGMPWQAEQAYQNYRNGLPEAVRAKLPEQYSGNEDKIDKQFETLRTKLADSVKQRQDVAIHKMDNESKEAVGRGHDNATIAAATIRAQKQNQDAITTLKNAANGKMAPKQAWTLANIIENTPGLDASTVAFAQSVKKSVEPAYRAELQKTGYDIAPDGSIRRWAPPDISPKANPGNPGAPGRPSGGPILRPGVVKVE